MPRSPLALLGLSVALLGLAACSNDEAVKKVTVVAPSISESGRLKESAGAFVKRHLQYEVNGEWGRDWDELHPLQQRVITRSQYVYCKEGEFKYRGNETVRVDDTYDNPIDVPGIPAARIMGASVAILSPGETREIGDTNFTDHAVKVEDGWRWILTGRELDVYRRGACLDGTKLTNATS